MYVNNLSLTSETKTTGVLSTPLSKMCGREPISMCKNKARSKSNVVIHVVVWLCVYFFV